MPLKHRYPSIMACDGELGHSCERMRCDLNDAEYMRYRLEQMSEEDRKAYLANVNSSPQNKAIFLRHFIGEKIAVEFVEAQDVQ